MKNYALLLFALLVVGCCNQPPQSATSQAKLPPAPERGAWDNERHPLYGDIESIVTIVRTPQVGENSEVSYRIDTVQCAWFNEAGDMDHRYVVDQHERASYNEQGKISTLTIFSLDEQLRTIRYYVYDDAGLLVEERGLDSEGEQTHKWLYEYNSSEQMLSSTFLSQEERNNLKNVFNYADGLLIEQQHYAAGVFTGSVLFNYDSAGNVTQRTFFVEKDAPMSSITFNYDAAGNKVDEIHNLYLDQNEFKAQQRYHYVYDAQGKRIAMEDYYYDEQGVEHAGPRYKYSYDSQNNVILTEFYRQAESETPDNYFEVHITYRE
jgi:hypothetical protein